jgi:hypothetical protein
MGSVSDYDILEQTYQRLKKMNSKCELDALRRMRRWQWDKLTAADDGRCRLSNGVRATRDARGDYK